MVLVQTPLDAKAVNLIGDANLLLKLFLAERRKIGNSIERCLNVLLSQVPDQPHRGTCGILKKFWGVLITLFYGSGFFLIILQCYSQQIEATLFEFFTFEKTRK